MAKKNKGKKESNQTTILITVAVLLLAGMAGFLFTSGGGAGDSTAVEQRVASNTVVVDGVKVIPTGRDDLLETGPILSPDYFDAYVGRVYRWASEIPKTFDSLYCYCRCKENPRFKHKSLLSCFADNHASMCKTCLDEGIMAHEMNGQGKTDKEIRAAVDARYAN